MSDTIERQAAIDAFNTNVDELVVAGKENADSVEKYLNGVIDKIKRLPSVQPEETIEEQERSIDEGLKSVQPQRWIPVSEALPKDDEEVIVTCLDDSGDTPFSYTTVAWHYKDMWVCGNELCPFVVGWMPLQEPWRGGQDDSCRKN